VEQLESRCLLAATHLRIDAGGSGFTEASGKGWSADRGFTGGTVVTAPFAVDGTDADAMFSTARVGTFGYSLPVTPGNYKLKLLFADGESTKVGQRLFTVTAEKKTVLSNFDIFNAAGAKSAVTKTADVTVRDGRLSLWFQSKRGEAMVSAIALLPVSPLGLQWKQVASAPIPRFESMSAAVNGKVFTFAGFHTNDIRTTKRSDAYDPATDQWTQISDAPEALSHAAVATDGARVYLAGGFVGDWKGVNTPVTNHVWIYNTSANAWSAGLDLPAPRAAGALVRVGRLLHFFGGVDSGIRDSGSHWVLDLRKPTAWKSAAAMPNPRNHLGYINYEGKIFAIGGQHQLDEENGNDTRVDVYDPASNTWRAVAKLPAPQSHIHNSTFIWGGRITMIGGSTVGHTSLANLTQYDPKRNKWVTIGYLPGPRSAAAAGLVGDKVVVTGGTLTEISPQTTTWILTGT
jgi:hypothetical protein